MERLPPQFEVFKKSWKGQSRGLNVWRPKHTIDGYKLERSTVDQFVTVNFNATPDPRDEQYMTVGRLKQILKDLPDDMKLVTEEMHYYWANPFRTIRREILAHCEKEDIFLYPDESNLELPIVNALILSYGKSQRDITTTKQHMQNVIAENDDLAEKTDKEIKEIVKEYAAKSEKAVYISGVINHLSIYLRKGSDEFYWIQE